MKQAEGNKLTICFLIPLLKCVFSVVLSAVMTLHIFVLKNMFFEKTWQNSCGLCEIQRNL